MPDPSPPLRMLNAPLKLTAMTLRGLGPYLHGARLEIKPLTILCGENGSGKSTWIDALQLLKETASSKPGFPLDEWLPIVDQDEKDPDGQGLPRGSHIERVSLNAHLVSKEEGGKTELTKQQSDDAKQARRSLLDPRRKENSLYGPAGCIGLEVLVVRDPENDKCPTFASPPGGVELQRLAQRLLWLGEFRAGKKIRLRLARPFENYTSDCEGLWDLIELTLNDEHTIHLRRSHERDWSKGGPRKDERWIFYGSETFLPGNDVDGSDAHDLAYLSEIIDEVGGKSLKVDELCDGCGESEKTLEDLANNFCILFKSLTQQSLAGFFPLGPIRELHQSDTCKMAPNHVFAEDSRFAYSPVTPEDDHDENNRPFQRIRPDLRFVGKRGEQTQELFGYWAYNLMCQPDMPSSQYWLETFVSSWLMELTQTRVEVASFQNERPDEPLLGGTPKLNGTLIDETWNWPRTGPFAVTINNSRNSSIGFHDFSRSLKPRTSLSWQGVGWHVMSTGFHQLAPIVVQAGLLHQNEIMAVENPEAHLHPSLQIKVAEFLMHQANAGKIMLIETHSDLIVRRVLRAILQEEIAPGSVFSQAQVSINFTELEPGEGFKYAVLKPLSVNDEGRIINWPPEGFMDDDIKESRRLLDAMYGTQSGDETDE